MTLESPIAVRVGESFFSLLYSVMAEIGRLDFRHDEAKKCQNSHI